MTAVRVPDLLLCPLTIYKRQTFSSSTFQCSLVGAICSVFNSRSCRRKLVLGRLRRPMGGALRLIRSWLSTRGGGRDGEVRHLRHRISSPALIRLTTARSQEVPCARVRLLIHHPPADCPGAYGLSAGTCTGVPQARALGALTLLDAQGRPSSIFAAAKSAHCVQHLNVRRRPLLAFVFKFFELHLLRA